MRSFDDPVPRLPDDGFAGKYRLETKPERRIEIVYDLAVDLTPADARGWLILLPEAPITDFQREVSMTVFKDGRPLPMRRVTEKSPLARPILQAVLDDPNDAAGLRLRAVFRATMYSRQFVPGPPPRPIAALSFADRLAFTRPTPTCNFDQPSVRSWIARHGLHRRAGEPVLPFALRVCRTIQSALVYEAPQPEPDFFACTHTVRTGRGDCGASNLLFGAVLRAERIPARVYEGRWSFAGRPRTGAETSHTKGEFWVDGIGWVPVDATAPEAGKSDRDLALDFGFDAGWYFATHVETDLQLDQPGFATVTLPWLHQRLLPHRAPGRDTWQGYTIRETWTTRHLHEIGTGWRTRNATR